MCEKEKPVLPILPSPAALPEAAGGAGPSPGGPGSRRRRVWELGNHAHCPVIGVCLPIQALRRLVEKVLEAPAPADDYELHCGAIAECKRRSPVAERLQCELDQRYVLAVRQAARCKTTETLAAWWAGQRTGGGSVPGALWATLTHPRCDTPLEDRVLADVHMLQHQLGAAQRVDAQRHAELVEEHGVLVRELAAVQERSTRVIAGKAACIERQSAELMRLRAELIGRDTLVAELREELATLEAAIPALRTRTEQARQIQAQLARIHELERSALRWQQRALALQERLAEQARVSSGSNGGGGGETGPGPAAAVAEGAGCGGGDPGEGEAAMLAPLRDKAVLCVGGRPGSVPVYRRLVERTGGRFLHHDGGEEDNPAQLDANLSAADLVICQTGCISHDAYWRVKDHCKRHGKQCLFVDKPSAASLAQGLRAIRVVQPS